MRPTLRGRAKNVIRCWDSFLRDPVHGLPTLSQSIDSLRSLIESIEKEESDNEPRLFK